VHPQVITALRSLFKLDDEADEAIEEALIGQGGVAALDQDAETEVGIHGSCLNLTVCKCYLKPFIVSN
jgi:xanthine dehydrogenase iron-sulfur cluster and FAD-binding subunit A